MNMIDLGCNIFKILDFVFGGVATAYDDYRFAFIEGAIAGGAVRNSAFPGILFLLGAELAGFGAGSNDDGFRRVFAVVGFDCETVISFINGQDFFIFKISAEFDHLGVNVFGEFCARNP